MKCKHGNPVGQCSACMANEVLKDFGKVPEKEFNPLDFHRERARELGGPIWCGD